MSIVIERKGKRCHETNREYFNIFLFINIIDKIKNKQTILLRTYVTVVTDVLLIFIEY